MGRIHLVVHDLQGAHGVRLAILLVAAQGLLAGHLGTDGPVVVVGVQRADGLARFPCAPIPVPEPTTSLIASFKGASQVQIMFQ